MLSSIPDSIPRLATSTPFLLSFLSLVLAYFSLARHCATLKQRSWLLTTLSSAVMSVASLPLLLQFVCARAHLQRVSIPPVFTDSAARFFQAYLIADLTLGMLFYRTKVNLLTGWIHHSVYVFIVDYAIQRHWSHIFCLCAVMEIPTFALAMGSILPRFRSDLFFALSFFATRIALHIIIGVTLAAQRQSVTEGSLGPAVIMACILPLHAHWFSGCIRGLLKRAKAAPHTPTPVAPRLLTNAPSLDRPSMPGVPGPASLYASRASLARRRTALRLAMRARWDQLKLWKAGGRLSDMQRRVRAALPGRERVYQYVGLETGRYAIARPEHLGDDRTLPS